MKGFKSEQASKDLVTVDGLRSWISLVKELVGFHELRRSSETTPFGKAWGSQPFVCTYDDLYSRWDSVMVGQDFASLGPGGVLIITPSVTILAQDERAITFGSKRRSHCTPCYT